MSWFTPGSKAIQSSQGIASNPSTATLVAEIDSTQIAAAIPSNAAGQNFQVAWIVGCSTASIWQLEHVLSTGLGSTALQSPAINVIVAKDQSAQFMSKHFLRNGDRLRARPNAGQASANAMVSIIAEPLD